MTRSSWTRRWSTDSGYRSRGEVQPDEARVGIGAPRTTSASIGVGSNKISSNLLSSTTTLKRHGATTKVWTISAGGRGIWRRTPMTIFYMTSCNTTCLLSWKISQNSCWMARLAPSSPKRTKVNGDDEYTSSSGGDAFDLNSPMEKIFIPQVLKESHLICFRETWQDQGDRATRSGSRWCQRPGDTRGINDGDVNPHHGAIWGVPRRGYAKNVQLHYQEVSHKIEILHVFFSLFYC